MAERSTRTSYEPRRTWAYLNNLRWRMVYQRETLQLSYEAIGSNLGVDPSTVCRTVSLFLSTSKVDKKKYCADNLPRKLTDNIKCFIMHIVLDNPGIMLQEIQNKVLKQHNVELARSTICKFLHSEDFSRQRMLVTARQRDEALRASFADELSVYRANVRVSR